MKQQIGTDLERAAFWIRMNSCIAIPTETVYGLAANAFSETAVKQVFDLKKRPIDRPLIAHVGHQDAVYELASEVSDLAKDLMDEFWPGPLTLILPRANGIPNYAFGSSGQIAVRMPTHPICLDLLRSLPFPLVAPSANPFSYVSPTQAAHVSRFFPDIPYILDGGSCAIGLESTIISLASSKPKILRLGAISVEELQDFDDRIVLDDQPSQSKMPGTHDFHYSPNCELIPFTHFDEIKKHINPLQDGLLWSSEPECSVSCLYQVCQHFDGAEREAARGFYSHLHKADLIRLKRIYVQWFPNKGVGKSLNDRIKKAAAKPSLRVNKSQTIKS